MKTLQASDVLPFNAVERSEAIQVLSAIPAVSEAHKKGTPFDELVQLADACGGEPLRRCLLKFENKYHTTRPMVLRSFVHHLLSPA